MLPPSISLAPLLHPPLPQILGLLQFPKSLVASCQHQLTLIMSVSETWTFVPCGHFTVNKVHYRELRYLVGAFSFRNELNEKMGLIYSKFKTVCSSQL